MNRPTNRGASAWAAWLLVVLLASVLAGCALPAPEGDVLQPLRLADGVYMFAGRAGAADEHNRGRIGNAGFIVGPRGVVVVDTGTSLAHGRELLAAIGRVTPLPVLQAIVTHTRPEFLFGGAAFREAGIPIVMHSRTARLMASRCETCLKALRQAVGEGPMQGTVMYKPDREFDAALDTDITGRALRVLYFGHSSGPGDVAVLDPASGVLFAGGLLDAGRVPDIQDSQLDGWRQALSALRALPLVRVVPGHGPASGPELVATVQGYLDQLDAKVRALVRSGTSLIDVADAAELPAFERWDQYDTVHRRNASVAYLRIERELLFK